MKKEKVRGLDKSLKLLVKTSFIVLIGLVLSKILGYLYRIIIARHYGPEVYGLFSLAIMISGVVIAVSAIGLSEGSLRFISVYRGRKEVEKIKYLFRFSLIALTITGILSGLLLFFLADYISVTFFHNAALSIYLKIFGIIIPASTLSFPFMAALRAHEEIYWYSFIYNISQNTIKVLILGLFIFLGFNSNATSLSYLAGVFGMLVLSYLICRYKIPHIFENHNLTHDESGLLRKEVMSYSIPILFFGIIAMIFYWIDSFSIGIYKGATEVGFYNVAVPIAMALTIAPEIFMQLFFPMITKFYARNKIKLIEQLSKQVTKWILIINLPVFAIMIVFPGAIINIFFGSQYLVAENALRILAIGSLASSIFITSTQLISVIGKSKLVLMNIVIASLINLGLNTILVPMQKIWFIENSLGLNGAALATLISVIILNLLFVYQSHKHLEIIPLKKKMINLFLIAAISTGLLFYLRTKFVSNNILTLLVLFLVFMITYITLILISKSLEDNDKKMIKTIFNKLKSIRETVH
jgi:O-antigen/teichoic acid export membrane protein